MKYITSTSGVRFAVRILRTGDRYGLDQCLTWTDDRPGVEFYDTRYDHTEYGQFVTRYNVDDVLDSTAGLRLCYGVPEWWIDAAAMDVVRAHLRAETAEPQLHAHIFSTATDCDGQIDRSYTIEKTFTEEMADFGDLDFRARVASSIISTTAVDAVLRVTSGGLEWSEPTEEGYRSVDVNFCTDACDTTETTYRDHRAESMGVLTMDEYATTPNHVRIFIEEDLDGITFSIDGADDEGRYTEECWSGFDTVTQAANAVPAFVEATTTYGVRWDWDSTTNRPRGLRRAPLYGKQD